MNKRRRAAIICLMFIGLLYLATLIFAFIDSPFAKNCLMAALFCSIVVPAACYGYMVFTGSRTEEPPERPETGESGEPPVTGESGE